MSSIADAGDVPGVANRPERAPRNRRGFWQFVSFLRTQTQWIVVLCGVLLFLLVFYWNSVFITIKSGEAGVMYRRFAGGTVTDRVLSEGIRFVPPWDTLFIYNVRLQQIPISMSALTADGLVVNLDISIRYRPLLDLVGLLQQRVGPDYAKTVVVPEVESSLRTIIGKQKMETIYTDADKVVATVIQASLEKVQRNYVLVDAVLVRSIELPKVVRERIEAKLVEKEVAATYPYRIKIAEAEAQRRAIEAGGVAKYNDIVNPSLTANVMQWEALQATKELAKSENAKTVIVGRGSDGLPIILGK
jgi:regulator of protease activity HflC (stomatin/prohibitin superfamily)